MSKTFFALSEFESRWKRVRSEMARSGIDVLIVVSPININYLVGAAAKSYQAFQCLLFPLEPGPLTMLLRLSDVAEVIDHSLVEDVRGWGGRKLEDPIEVLTKIIADKGYAQKRLALECPPYYLSVAHHRKLQVALGDNLVADATTLVEDLKLVKSPAELTYIRRAAEIADIGMESIVRSLAVGRTEREVAAEAHRAMMAAGGDSPPSPMNFVSGERTCYAHGLPSDRVLQNGDFMHIEYGASYRRYTSTIARHLSIGHASARARELHDVTREACDACIASIKAGVPAEVPHLAAVEAIRKAGLEEFNLHLTGYGIAPGFPPSWGETLNMFYGSKYVLQAGMVVSVEPPIFIHRERMGARLIDCVIVKEDGAEILSRYPRDLIEL